MLLLFVLQCLGDFMITDKRIIYPYNDTVMELTPSPNWSKSLEELIEKDVPANTPFVTLDKTQIPEDLTFRNAWEFNSEVGILINIEKSKQIWKDKWREARKPILASLDIEFMKAVEAGDSAKQAEIASKKQELRDVTAIEISGNSPEEIKAVWPAVLGEKP